MMDIMGNRDEIKRAMLRSFQSHKDDNRAYSKDHFEKYKHEGCWELHRGHLKFYESDNPANSTTTTVVSVEKRRGTNMLILRCGPGGRMILFLEFDSKRSTDEWQEALCSFTGQSYDPNPGIRRWKSDLDKEMKKKVIEMRKRIKSSLPDIDDVEQSDSDPERGEEAPPAPPARYSPEPETEDSDEPRSLRSRDLDISPTLEELAKISVEQECSIEDLQKLHIMDYRSNVIVKAPLTTSSCQLHLGDIIEVKNINGRPMNAEELTEHIRTTSTEQSIKLTVIRGPVCVIRKEERELVLDIMGSKTVSPDPVDAIMKAGTSPCTLHDAAGSENSNLTITEINGNPLDSHSQPDQISEMLKDGLESSSFLTLRLVPQSLLDAVVE